MIICRKFLTPQGCGVTYLFQKDEALPWHWHPEELAHNVVIAQGEVQLEFEDESLLLSANQICEFDNSRLHRIRCVSERAMVLSYYRHGPPANFSEMPPCMHFEGAKDEHAH
jgi:quercetin dioxygenase-like cupin family protein